VAGAVVAVAALAGGCAVPFGVGGEGGRPPGGVRGNLLYLEEQERIERSRQSFGDQYRYPSDR
jgi:hypothetical protein